MQRLIKLVLDYKNIINIERDLLSLDLDANTVWLGFVKTFFAACGRERLPAPAINILVCYEGITVPA